MFDFIKISAFIFLTTFLKILYYPLTRLFTHLNTFIGVLTYLLKMVRGRAFARPRIIFFCKKNEKRTSEIDVRFPRSFFKKCLSTKNSHGAADRGRTDMVSLPLDFESSASANSTTAAY